MSSCGSGKSGEGSCCPPKQAEPKKESCCGPKKTDANAETKTSCCPPKKTEEVKKEGGCCGSKKECGPKKESVEEKKEGGCCVPKKESAEEKKEAKSVQEEVQDYYGKVLQASSDLKTNACCTGEAPPPHIKQAMAMIHPEVSSRYYGCGLVIPELLEGCHVLDLGSGAGQDCFILSKLVGQSGHVIGVDMTDEQLAVANRHIDYHTQAFKYSTPNVEFRKGYIEKLQDAGLPDNSLDVIVSNCVINLCPDKNAVLREAFRVLKPGGELYFGDVYADRRVPEELTKDKVLWGECLSGALYWGDFMSLARANGFADVRLVDDSIITIDNKKVEELIGHIRFWSATYRLFKLSDLDSQKEDYGHAVEYKGTVESCPKEFKLDCDNVYTAGKVTPVDRNSYRMLKETRFAPHFAFYGSGTTHYGPFKTDAPYRTVHGQSDKTANMGGCC
eukprot:comp19938_c0_seq1/m.24237 comp19938_c0_seq1/g.24237  ORF comp19938_c0_seq1/g.24237 comp19938_c0_seq1/m.24237 type:complete len:446 (-) comp19938_c0_seq1:756-2093(-)